MRLYPFKKESFRWFGGILAIAGIVFIALRLRDYGAEIDFSRFDTASWTLVIGLALAYGMDNLMLALAWYNLLAYFDVDVKISWSIKVYGISHLSRYLPGNIFHLTGRQVLSMADGIQSWPLVKSTIWELWLISFTGALFSLLALPLLIPSISGSVAISIFLFMVIATIGFFQLFHGSRVAGAMGCYVGFLLISAITFICLIYMVSVIHLPDGVYWINICGAYVLAWLAGLLTPGAPAGLGVRELVLMLLLRGIMMEHNIILSVLLARLVTVLGDFIFFMIASINYYRNS